MTKQTKTDPDLQSHDPMIRALAIAKRDGIVCAGKGEHTGRVERVAASTIRALIRRGILAHCYSPDGGLAGRLPMTLDTTEMPSADLASEIGGGACSVVVAKQIAAVPSEHEDRGPGFTHHDADDCTRTRERHSEPSIAYATVHDAHPMADLAARIIGNRGDINAALAMPGASIEPRCAHLDERSMRCARQLFHSELHSLVPDPGTTVLSDAAILVGADVRKERS